MPRPRKGRRVCALPESKFFGPINEESINKEACIIMTVEEYETIRLIDYENLMQEECAKIMNVARTTVQRIYYNARYKLAEALINGKSLSIEGGNYVVCETDTVRCGNLNCRRHGYGRNRR